MILVEFLFYFYVDEYFLYNDLNMTFQIFRQTIMFVRMGGGCDVTSTNFL